MQPLDKPAAPPVTSLSPVAVGPRGHEPEVRAAIGTAIAIASSVAASGASTLLRAGGSAPSALTGGFRQTFWVLGAIALIAPPVVFALVRRTRATKVAAKPVGADARRALATGN